MSAITNICTTPGVSFNRLCLVKNPQVARALLITITILSLLSLISSLAIFITMPLGVIASCVVGAALMGGGFASLFCASKLAGLIRNARKLRFLNLLSASDKTLSPERREYLQSCVHYCDLMREFSNVDVEVSNRDREILRLVGQDTEINFDQYVDQIQEHYQRCQQLMACRERLFYDELPADDEALSNSQLKNKMVIRMAHRTLENFQKLREIFSFTFSDLSKTWSKVHLTGLITMTVIAVISLTLLVVMLGGTLPVSTIVTIGLGMAFAVIGLSYGTKYIIKRSSWNKRQIAKDFIQESLDIQALATIASLQSRLLRKLKNHLSLDLVMTQISRPLRAKYSHVQIASLLEQTLADMDSDELQDD